MSPEDLGTQVKLGGPGGESPWPPHTNKQGRSFGFVEEKILGRSETVILFRAAPPSALASLHALSPTPYSPFLYPRFGFCGRILLWNERGIKLFAVIYHRFRNI